MCKYKARCLLSSLYTTSYRRSQSVQVRKRNLKNIKSIGTGKKEVMLLTDDITVYVKKC